MIAKHGRHGKCFAPVANRNATTLVLGSLPGQRSLQMQQYYAHPQNVFWRLIADIFEADASLPYAQRVKILASNGIALWDVFAAAERPGSLDSSIVHASARLNDFAEFFRGHPRIRRVFFNGRKAEEIFRRVAVPELGPVSSVLSFECLPSTSPAHAGMSYAKKLASWRKIRA